MYREFINKQTIYNQMNFLYQCICMWSDVVYFLYRHIDTDTDQYANASLANLLTRI